MKQYYECHVTIESANRYMTEMKVLSVGWTFSAIDGDPILGEGVKCYATKHFNSTKNNVEEVIAFVDFAAASIHDSVSKVVRRKVELVLYDNRELINA